MTQYTEILEGMQVLLVTEDPARAEALSRALRDHKAHVGDLKSGRREPSASGADLLLIDARSQARTAERIAKLQKDVRGRWAAKLVLDFTQLVRDDGSVHFSVLKDAVTPLVEPDRALTERAQNEASFTAQLSPLGPSRTLRALSFAGHTLHVELRHPSLEASVELANELLVCATAKRDGQEWDAWQALVRILGLSDAVVSVSRRAYPSSMNIMEPVHQALEVAAQERHCASESIASEEADAAKAAAAPLDKPAMPVPPPPPAAARPQRTLLGVAPSIPALGKSFAPSPNLPPVSPPSRTKKPSEPRYTHRSSGASAKLKPGLTLMGMAAPQLGAKPSQPGPKLDRVPPANNQTATPPEPPAPAVRKAPRHFASTQALNPGVLGTKPSPVAERPQSAPTSDGDHDLDGLEVAPLAEPLSQATGNQAQDRDSSPELSAAPTERPPPGMPSPAEPEGPFADNEVTVVADEQAVNALREQAELDALEEAIAPAPKAPPPAMAETPAAASARSPDAERSLPRAVESEPPATPLEETLVVRHEQPKPNKSGLKLWLSLVAIAAVLTAGLLARYLMKAGPAREPLPRRGTTTLADLEMPESELAPSAAPSHPAQGGDDTEQAAEPQPAAVEAEKAGASPAPAAEPEANDEQEAAPRATRQPAQKAVAPEPAADDEAEAENAATETAQEQAEPEPSEEEEEGPAKEPSGEKPDARALARQGLRLLNQGDTAGAQVSFEQALAADPQNPHAYDGLARVFLREKKLTEAQEAAEQAISLRSRRGRYYVLLGDIQNAQGNKAKARQAWEKALELDPDDAAAQRRLGE